MPIKYKIQPVKIVKRDFLQAPKLVEISKKDRVKIDFIYLFEFKASVHFIDRNEAVFRPATDLKII